MPLPDIVATAFVVYGSDEKQPFVNVLHYFQVGEFLAEQVEASDLASSVDAAIGSALVTILPADCTYMRSVVRINNNGVVFEASNESESGPGAVAGQSLPDYCAMIIRKRTGVGGKRGRGRWYVGCVAEANQDTGEIVTGALAATAALADALGADRVTDAGTWRSGHLSRANDTLVPITSTQRMVRLGTMRRRLVRPGF